MNRGPALSRGLLGALVVALALVASVGVAGAHPGHAAGGTTDVDVRVWQHVRDPLRIHISARPEGTRWDALGTIPLLLDDGLSSSRNFRFGDVTVEGVEVRVWQQISNPRRIDISARPVGGDWDVLGTIRLPLDDGFSSSGNYRYGDITVAVPAAHPEPPAVVVSPGGREVPRLAALTFTFADPPAETDGPAFISFEPPIEGAFVRLDSRTLLFQPDYPGWQRGQQYEVVVDAGPVGLVSDYTHAFRVEGQLEVASVIPGDRDTDVPTNAQILVQFNRSVAPLTVLQEGPGAAVLEFDPPLDGAGEWLNTSLYRFIPTNLEPSTTYSVRIPAGLTSAVDGVLEADYTWSFSTIQPAVGSITPHDGATFVEPDDPIVVTFNQPMDRASVEAGVKLRAVGGAATPGSFEWDEDGTVVTLTPDEPMELLTLHDVTISAGLASVSGGMTRSERTARFTTIGLPELVSTYPKDGATNARPYSVDLHYNNPMDVESFEERVSISGIDAEDIEVRWYTWDANTIRIHFDYEYSTEYTVRIAEGVRDRGGRPLPAYEFSFTTRDPYPSLSLAAGTFSTYSASHEQVLYYHAARFEDVRFELFRLPDEESETLLRRGFIDGYLSGRGHVTFWPAGEPLREWTEGIDEELRGASRLYSTTLGSPEPLAKGHYFLAATGKDAGYTLKRVFSVVDTAIVTKLAFDELLVWALDYDTGAPLDATSVRAGSIDEVSPGPYQHGITDEDGLALLATTDSRATGYWSWYGERLVRIEEEGRLGVASTAWDFGATPWDLEVPASPYEPGPVGHLFTERPIYRPGETVFYKGVVRLDDDAAYSVPGASATFSLRIRDAAYDSMQSTQVELNDLGSFSGELILPTDAPTGTYWIWIRDENDRHITTAHFTVAEFRVPEFEVEVEAESGDYVAGDTIATGARAAFFFGGPVAGAGVEWTAQSIPTSITVEDYEDYSFSERTYWWWWDGNDERNPRRSQGEGRTDSEGVARFDVPADLDPDEGTQAFTISATVTDQNAQAIAGSTTVTVHPATWYAGIKVESYIGKAEEPTTVHLVTVDYEGTIAPNRPVTVRAFEREWIRTKERADHGGYRYRYELQETEVDVQTVTTGADGEASIEFMPPAAGSYRLVAESTDGEGRVARSARYLWVSGSDIAPWPVRENDVIDLIAGSERYEVGDVAEVLVPAPFAGATGLVTIERGRVLSTEVRRFETNSEVLRIPIEDGHIPNIYVGVVLYRPPTDEDPYPRYHVGYVELSISTAPRRLDVSIEPDRERATPGETVSYDVLVTDSEGNGVEADVSVAVVDQAVLSLRAESTRDGTEAFWFERALGVRTASSLAVSVDRGNEAFDEVVEGEKGAGDDERDGEVAEEAAMDMDDAAPAVADTGEGDAGDSMAFRATEESGEAPQVRSNFQNTALWIGQLVTDADGKATFELELPDNATTWRAQARAVTAETLVGQGESELLVTQPLLVRPALPRFLRVGDEVSLRTLVRNGTDEVNEVTFTIAAEGVVVDGDGVTTRRLEPGESAIFSWPARALQEGTATVRFTATTTGGYGDAVELSLPVHLDVTPETTATGGVVEDTARIEAIFLPEYVITGSGSLELALQASLVGALDEELAHFWPPYHWESNVSIASRIVATIAVQRASASGLTDGQERQLKKDIDRLLEAQMYDGGWAWCRSCYRTDPWVTGWVLIALGEARDSGYAVLDSDYRYDRTTRLITEHVQRRTDVMRPADVNQHAFLLYALTSAANEGGEVSPFAREQAALLRSLVEEHRTQLTNWGRAYAVLGLLASVEKVREMA